MGKRIARKHTVSLCPRFWRASGYNRTAISYGEIPFGSKCVVTFPLLTNRVSRKKRVIDLVIDCSSEQLRPEACLPPRGLSLRGLPLRCCVGGGPPCFAESFADRARLLLASALFTADRSSLKSTCSQFTFANHWVKSGSGSSTHMLLSSLSGPWPTLVCAVVGLSKLELKIDGS